MKKFPFLELGIIIAFAILLYILIYPSYVQNKSMNIKYNIISNMYGCRVAYEKFATLDNLGVLPDSINNKIIDYINELGLTNPVDGSNYTLEDIQIYQLYSPLEINDYTLSGKHAQQRGKPGTFAIGIFQSDIQTYNELINKEKLTKADKKVLKQLDLSISKYTVIGFGVDSLPVMLEDETSKELEVYILKGQKTSID